MTQKRRNIISLHIKDDSLYKTVRERAIAAYGEGYGSISKYICDALELKREKEGDIHKDLVNFLGNVKDKLKTLEQKSPELYNLVETEHPDTPTWFFNKINIALHPVYSWTEDTVTKLTNLSMAASLLLKADSLVIIVSKLVSKTFSWAAVT